MNDGPRIENFHEVQERFGGEPTPYDPKNPMHNPDLIESPYYVMHKINSLLSIARREKIGVSHFSDVIFI